MSRSPFDPRVAIGLVAVGIIAFAALILLLAYGSGLGSGQDGRPHALSTSATGYKALYRLVGEFRPVRTVRDPRGLITSDLLIVTLEEKSTAEQVAELVEARANLTTLFILPKWATVPDPKRRGWVRAVFPGAGSAAAAGLGNGIEIRSLQGDAPRRARGTGLAGGLEFPVPPSAQLAEGKAVDPIVALGRGGTLVGKLYGQPHYLVADPDLLNNHGLSDPATARAALALIDRVVAQGSDGAVAFDLTLNGFGGDAGLLRLALEPPFLPATLALLLAALLAGIAGAHRFGPLAGPRRAIALGKTALVENSAGLIRLAGREARLGRAYADLVRGQAGRAARAPPGLAGAELDQWLDRFNRPDTGMEPFSRLAAAVEQARDRHHLIAAAQALARWRSSLSR